MLGALLLFYHLADSFIQRVHLLQRPSPWRSLGLSVLPKGAIMIIHVQCFPQTWTLFVAAYMQIHSLPAGGAFRARRNSGFPGNAVHKLALSSQTLLYQTLHARWNENDIHNFMKTVGFLQKCSDIKTPALCFDFETCSARIFKAFWKNLFVAVSFDIVAGRHK